MSSEQTDSLSSPLMQDVLDGCPFPIMIYRPDGLLVGANLMAEQFWRAPRKKFIGIFNLLTDPQGIELGTPQIFERVSRREVVAVSPIFYDTSQVAVSEGEGAQAWVEVTYFPICNTQGHVTHVGAIQRDITDEMARQKRIEEAQREINSQREMIEALEEARREIDNQRETIQALSSPVIQVWEGILTLPLVGPLDAHRATSVTEHLLEAIVSYQADIVIIDITGVPVVDTQVASYLISATSACRLLGSEVVLVGIGGEIAQAIVHLGVDLSAITTRANLQAGLTWAFDRLGLDVVSRRSR